MRAWRALRSNLANRWLIFVFLSSSVASNPDHGGNPDLSANPPPASSPHFRPTMQSPGPPYQSEYAVPLLSYLPLFFTNYCYIKCVIFKKNYICVFGIIKARMCAVAPPIFRVARSCSEGLLRCF